MPPNLVGLPGTLAGAAAPSAVHNNLPGETDTLDLSESIRIHPARDHVVRLDFGVVPLPILYWTMELTRFLGHLILGLSQGKEAWNGSIVEVSGGVPA